MIIFKSRVWPLLRSKGDFVLQINQMTRAAAALFVFFTGATALAATSAEVEQARRAAERLEQQESQRQQEQLLRDRAGAAPKTQLAVPEVPVVAQKAGPCREIKTVQISGVTLLPKGQRVALARAYEGRCLGVTEIEGLLSDLTRAYMREGWVMARAYLPQQDLSLGTLQVQVVEGRVSRIMINDGDKHSINRAMVAPFTVGEPLNLRDFEQALDQVNRLASNAATIAMLPGETAGDTVVQLNNTPTLPLHGSFSEDNQGSSSTGENQGSATLSYDNPLRINDFISYTRRESVPSRTAGGRSTSNSYSYIVPFGYTTFTLSASDSAYTSQLVTQTGTTLVSSGESGSQAVRVDQVLFRDADTRLNAFANVTAKETQSFLEQTLLSGASRRLTVLDAGVSYSTVVLGGALTLETGLSEGLTWRDALKDAVDIAGSTPHAQFRKWTFGGSYLHPVTPSVQFSSQWTAQHSEDVLFGSEQILIGGIYSVRGFTNSTISGDHGYYLRNEVSTRRNFSRGQIAGSYKPWVALDHGGVTSRNDGVQEGHLTGVAAGVQFSLRKGPSLEVFVARPVSLPDELTRESSESWARLSFSF